MYAYLEVVVLGGDVLLVVREQGEGQAGLGGEPLLYMLSIMMIICHIITYRV
jgi:hypothetical protein